jgi:uncharacterized protein YfkK (UPF0435 family)|tara:strand:+ start:44 stop:148 length:105 start_codon:yes stop_codon:yes gene_type:complete
VEVVELVQDLEVVEQGVIVHQDMDQVHYKEQYKV